MLIKLCFSLKSWTDLFSMKLWLHQLWFRLTARMKWDISEWSKGKNTCFQTGDQTQMLLISRSVRRPHSGSQPHGSIQANSCANMSKDRPAVILLTPNPLYLFFPRLPFIYSSPFGSCLVKSRGGRKQLTRGLKSLLLTGNWTFSSLDSCLHSCLQ